MNNDTVTFILFTNLFLKCKKNSFVPYIMLLCVSRFRVPYTLFLPCVYQNP